MLEEDSLYIMYKMYSTYIDTNLISLEDNFTCLECLFGNKSIIVEKEEVPPLKKRKRIYPLKVEEKEELIFSDSPPEKEIKVNSKLCMHHKIRAICRKCKGNSICCHDKVKSVCIICSPHNFCFHNRNKWKCSRCNYPISTSMKMRCTYKTEEIQNDYPLSVEELNISSQYDQETKLAYYMDLIDKECGNYEELICSNF
jgi:hypothetical protein